MKKLISIVTPTFNEESNIEKLCNDISIEMRNLNYDYEHIIIDNIKYKLSKLNHIKKYYILYK